MPNRPQSLPIGRVAPHGPIFKKVPDSQAINEFFCGCHRKFLLLKDFVYLQEQIMSDWLARVVLQVNEFSPQISGATARFRVGCINSGMARDEDCHSARQCPSWVQKEI
jgi:hypothetical protein